MVLVKRAFILLGAPASGKGTQARMVADRYGLKHISTGDMLRQSIQERTPMGLIAQACINKGLYVPDETVLELVEKRIQLDDCKNGILTDGFPRTLNQAISFDKFANVQKVVNVSVEFETLKARICGRRVCGKCNRVYHVSKHTSPLCECGDELYIRKDDTEETFETRYRQYTDLTKPLIDYYADQGKLVEIDGNATIEMVFDRISKALD